MIRLVKNALKSFRAKALGRQFDYFSAFVFAIDRLQFNRCRRPGALTSPDKTEEAILSSLKNHGFYVWNDFLSPEVCEKLRENIETIAIRHPEFVHPGTSHDLRLHGIENICDDFKQIAAHGTLLKVANIYLKEPTRTAFSLAARLESSESKLGSGGGWHRDSNFPQLKAMVYLSDVTERHGPFQLISGSHRFIRSIRDNKIGKQIFGEVRWSAQNVERVLVETGQQRLNTLVGRQGTLIIFDSSTIHRGSPITDGRRYAVTNYFYPERFIDSSLYEHFAPVAGFV